MNTFRMTISVPLDLKSKMDDTNGVVWSAVACDAFRSKLAEIESRKAEAKTMTDVVERMRAAMKREENEDRESGYQDGRSWAQRRAEPRELRRLEAAHDSGDWQNIFDAAHNEEGGSAFNVTLARILSDNAETDWSDARDYWNTSGIREEDLQTEDYAEAFVEGALNVWAEVQEALRNPPGSPIPLVETPKRGRPAKVEEPGAPAKPKKTK